MSNRIAMQKKPVAEWRANAARPQGKPGGAKGEPGSPDSPGKSSRAVPTWLSTHPAG